jgi:hypothetical protein
LDRRLGGPQSQSGRRGEENNLALPGIEPVIAYCVVGNAVSGVCRDTAVTVVELKCDFSSMSCEAEIAYGSEPEIA